MAEVTELDLIENAIEAALDAMRVPQELRERLASQARPLLAVVQLSTGPLVIVPSPVDGYSRYRLDGERMNVRDLLLEISERDGELLAELRKHTADVPRFEARPEPLRLTRAEARDPKVYRRALRQAEEEGRAVEIAAHDPAERRPAAQSGQVVGGVLYLSRAHAREVARYRDATERAQREGLALEILD